MTPRYRTRRTYSTRRASRTDERGAGERRDRRIDERRRGTDERRSDGGRDRPSGEGGERRGYRAAAANYGEGGGGSSYRSSEGGGYRSSEGGGYRPEEGSGYGPGSEGYGGYYAGGEGRGAAGPSRGSPARPPPGEQAGRAGEQAGRGQYAGAGRQAGPGDRQAGPGERQAGPGEYAGPGQRSARRRYGPPSGGRTAAPRGMETARYPEQFVDHLTPEMRMLLDDSIEASQVAAWCADRCIEHGPEAGDCVRLCNEVAQIADLNANFISKDAFNVVPVTEAFVAVAEQAIVELEEIPQVHAEETRAVLERAIDSARNVL